MHARTSASCAQQYLYIVDHVPASRGLGCSPTCWRLEPCRPVIPRGQPCGHDEWIEVFRDDDRALGATFAGNEGHGGYGHCRMLQDGAWSGIARMLGCRSQHRKTACFTCFGVFSSAQSEHTHRFSTPNPLALSYPCGPGRGAGAAWMPGRLTLRCWFFPALGSGVFLNVGRTKLIYRKSNVADLMAEWQGVRPQPPTPTRAGCSPMHPGPQPRVSAAARCILDVDLPLSSPCATMAARS